MLINRVSTRDNLIKRGVNLLSQQCIMCGRGEESIQHLFFECNYVLTVWKLCDQWTCLANVYHNKLKKHF